MSQRYLAQIQELVAPDDFSQISEQKGEPLFAADCTQNSYLTLLNTQDIVIGDYTSLASYFTPEKRAHIVNLLMHIHKQKKYKMDTFYIAVSLMDRYLKHVCESADKKIPAGPALAVICMLMAAKLEQPVSPSFNRMITCLPSDYRGGVTKPDLLRREVEIIFALEFSL